MENLEHYDVHRANIRNSVILGLTVPGPRKPSTLFSLYSTFLNTYQIVVFFLMSLSVVLQQTSIHRILVDVDAAYCTMFGFAVSIYYSFYTKQLQELIKRFNEITNDCLNDPLDDGRTFKERLNTENRVVYKCASIIPLTTGICPMTYYAIGVARSLRLFGMDGKRDVTVDTIIPNLDQSPNFEIAQVTCMISIQLGITRKAAVEWFLISLMALSRTYINHIEMTLMKVFSDAQDRNLKSAEKHMVGELENDEIERKVHFNVESRLVEERIKLWVKIHQKVLRLNEDLIVALSPLMAFYLVNITTLSALTVFAVTMDEEMIFVEKMSMGYFGVSSVITLLLLCSFGNQLFLKSGKLANLAFYKCFESGSGMYSKNVYNSLKVIFQRTQSPIVYAPYKSPSFTFTNESSVSFAWSMISFFFAIKKLKEIASESKY
ncbi:uncharacterized protein LOC120354823 [Nilaparvata lugens]|uniref:uncharacterized protein LOC120354823 n=1 Tax=Nilaparvata lugens TaxID=108931 RepID=UPI00193DB5F2|nr:uncharacterized protein LOC120354823 [Nilaparvata lugens]